MVIAASVYPGGQSSPQSLLQHAKSFGPQARSQSTPFTQKVGLQGPHSVRQVSFLT